MSAFTHELIRYALVLVTIPLWLPFVKAMWKELNRALRYEGGLLGKLPTPQEVREIEREAMREENPLVHEPLPPRGGAARPRFRQPAQGQRAERGATRPAAPRAGLGTRRPSARGFR